MTAAPLAGMTLRRDRRRSLARARGELAARGLVPVFAYQPAVCGSSLARQAGRAYMARNIQAGRDWDPRWFSRAYDSADEIATLRVDGRLAAWALACHGCGTYHVTAGQMVPGFEWCRPGFLLEDDMLRRARDELGFTSADFGDGHPEALLTAGATCPG